MASLLANGVREGALHRANPGHFAPKLSFAYAHEQSEGPSRNAQDLGIYIILYFNFS